jgi:tetratricopeptide (TPR) repeat protein
MRMNVRRHYNENVLTRLSQAVLVVSIAALFPVMSYGQQMTVLINAFENQTGDRTLDWIGEGLSTTMGERLGTQPKIYVFGFDERVAEYDRLGLPEIASFSRATAIRMAWDMGADILVTGWISGTHDAFQINARILNLIDDTTGPDISVTGKLDEVISMAASLASQLSLRLIPGSVLPESDYAARPPVPRSAFEAYTRGIMTKDTQRRVELLQSAIRLHPQYRAAIYQLGQVHYLDSNYKNSSELLEKIPVDTPEYPQARFMVGMNAYHLGDYAKAAEIFSTLAPTYDVLVNLGASLVGTGDPVAATSAWRRALEQNATGVEAAFNLGYLSFSRSDWELAASRLAQFLQEHSRDSEAVFLLGRTYDRLGRVDESRRLTAQALRSSPRLERWLSQSVPNLVRVRTQFNATELRMSKGGGVWDEPRRLRRAVALAAADALSGARP